MYCISCDKNKVKPLKNKENNFLGLSIDEQNEDLSEIDILYTKKVKENGSIKNINNMNIDGGIIQIIDAGYGSIHDGDQYIIAICDDCINEKTKDGTLLYYGNYMFEYYDNKDDIDKSKREYTRRKNLDDLVD